MDSHLKMASIPILGDSNFEQWKQSLTLLANALSVEEYLVVDKDPSKLTGDDKKHFYTFTNLMLSSLSERP